MPTVNEILQLPNEEHMRIFFETVLVGSVSAAAMKLGIGQSTVTYHIQSLEKELGVELLDRTTRPARPTAAGRELVKQLEFIYQHLRQSVVRLKNENGQLSNFRLGIVESLSVGLGPALVEHFVKTSHRIQMTAAASTEFLLNMMTDDKLDFVIGCSPRIDTRLFKKTVLYHEPSVLAMPKSFAHSQTEWAWNRLRFCGLPFISSNLGTGNNEITQSLFTSLFLTLPDKVEVNESGLRLALICRGVGWSLIRPVVIEKHPTLMRDIALFPMPEPILERTIYLACRKGEFRELQGEIAEFSRRYFSEVTKKKALQVAPWLADYFKTHVVA